VIVAQPHHTAGGGERGRDGFGRDAVVAAVEPETAGRDFLETYDGWGL